MEMIERLRDKIVVSVQAMPSEPLYAENCMLAMMKSVINGGAGALRVAGASLQNPRLSRKIGKK